MNDVVKYYLLIIPIYLTIFNVVWGSYVLWGDEPPLLLPPPPPPTAHTTPNRHCALIALREINLDFCAALDSRSDGSGKYFSNVSHAKNNSFRCDVFLFKPPPPPRPQRPLSATHKALLNSFLLCNVSLLRSPLKEKRWLK